MTHSPTEHSAVPEGYKPRKKPIYKRVWFWLLAIILAIILAVIAIPAMSGGGNDPSGGSVSGDTARDAADPPAGPTFSGQQQGDTVAATGQTIPLNHVKITTTPLYDGRAVGSTPVVCSTVVIVNTGDAAVSFDGGVDWKLQDPAGVARGTIPGGTDTLLGSGELGPGGAVARDVCFDNTAGTPGQYALLYQPVSSSGDRAVWLSIR